MQGKDRGSLELIKRRMRNRDIVEDDVAKFVEAVEFDGSLIDDVFILGIPNPDVIKATIGVKKEVFGKLSNSLIDVSAKGLRIKTWEVFPYGIPVIDKVLVNIEVVKGF